MSQNFVKVLHRSFILFLLVAPLNAALAVEPLPFTLLKNIASPIEKSIRWDAHGPLDTKVANKLAAERIKALQELLTPTPNPYDGKISTPEICLPKNLPRLVNQKTKDGFASYLSFYSSDSNVLASCVAANQLLKTQFLLLYCRNSSTLYFIRYFYPSSEAWHGEAIASCGKRKP